MELTDNLKGTIEKMHSLKMPRNARREYIIGAYSCLGKIFSWPTILNSYLDEITKENLSGEKAVLDLEKRFQKLDREYAQEFSIPPNQNSF